MRAMDTEAEVLRDAAARGDFAAAEKAVVRFAERVRSQAADLAPAEAASRLREACDLIEWSRRNLCAARARLEQDTHRLECVRRYLE